MQNFSTKAYTESGVAVRMVLCLLCLNIKKHELVNKNNTKLVSKPCDRCGQKGGLS